MNQLLFDIAKSDNPDKFINEIKLLIWLDIDKDIKDNENEVLYYIKDMNIFILLDFILSTTHM